MITAIPILILASVAQVLLYPFSLIDLVIPEAIGTSLVFVLSHIKYAHAFIDINELMDAVAFVLAAWSGIYIIKIVLWIFGFMPFLNVKKTLPTHNK